MTERTPPDIDLRAPLPSGPGMLQLFGAGYVLSSVLFSAVELGVFDLLAKGPADAPALAARAGLPEDALRRLLTALTAMGLVTRDDAGAYQNGPLAAAALTSSPHSL